MDRPDDEHPLRDAWVEFVMENQSMDLVAGMHAWAAAQHFHALGRREALEEAERLRAALTSALSNVKWAKGKDSPLWTHADPNQVGESNPDMDPQTWTACYAAECFDRLEADIEAALNPEK